VNADQKTMRELSKSFRAEKASSGTVSASFGTQNEEESKKIANAAFSVISEKTKNLNSEARDPNWFQVEMSNLVIAKNVQDLRINLGIATLLGIFIGSFLAFGKHYISEETEK
jgi:capsular polysaccharide biosynthesis protein